MLPLSAIAIIIIWEKLSKANAHDGRMAPGLPGVTALLGRESVAATGAIFYICGRLLDCRAPIVNSATALNIKNGHVKPARNAKACRLKDEIAS